MLTLFVAFAFVVLIAAGSLEAHLPEGRRGMIQYALTGTLFFFFVWRMRSHSPQPPVQDDQPHHEPTEPAARVEAAASDSLDDMRSRIRERKRRNAGKDTVPDANADGIRR
jgi:hypothetical protein